MACGQRILLYNQVQRSGWLHAQTADNAHGTEILETLPVKPHNISQHVLCCEHLSALIYELEGRVHWNHSAHEFRLETNEMNAVNM